MLTKVKKEPIPPLIRIREVAALLSVSRQTVHHLIENGQLDASRYNSPELERKHVRITRNSLCKYYEEHFGHPLSAALASPFEVQS